MKISFELNGKDIEVDVPPMTRLLDLLREDLGLTGTKEGCGEGECGACSVLIDGLSVNSCLVPVIQVEGCKVTTIEGLSQDKKFTPIQDLFVEHGATQCGLCTPGILVTTAELKQQKKEYSQADIREALSGNLCRCTGYQKIVEAAHTVLNDSTTTDNPKS